MRTIVSVNVINRQRYELLLSIKHSAIQFPVCRDESWLSQAMCHSLIHWSLSHNTHSPISVSIPVDLHTPAIENLSHQQNVIGIPNSHNWLNFLNRIEIFFIVFFSHCLYFHTGKKKNSFTKNIDTIDWFFSYNQFIRIVFQSISKYFHEFIRTQAVFFLNSDYSIWSLNKCLARGCKKIKFMSSYLSSSLMMHSCQFVSFPNVPFIVFLIFVIPFDGNVICDRLQISPCWNSLH